MCLLTLTHVHAQTDDPDEPPPPPTPPTEHPDRTFGAVETYHTPEKADEADVGWSRMIFYWSELKKDGPDEWNEHHAPYWRVDREIEGGREVVGLLKHTPKFATDGIVGAGVPYGLDLPIDDPRNLWAGFVRETMTRYKGRVSRWIIWNEPDIPIDVFGAQWQGTVEEYYRLVKVAYLVGQEVDPDIKIHLGGLTYWHNPTYLREFLTAASTDPAAIENGYYFNVVSVHVYFKPETTLDIVSSLRTQLAEFGLDKPIWINETNAPPYDDPLQPWDEPVFRATQEMQASFLLQEFALALAAGVERISVYKWIDEPAPQPGFEPYGLLRIDRIPRPAYDAFAVITKHYAHVIDAQHIAHPAFHQVILFREDTITRVLWARVAREMTVSLPASGDAGVLVDQAGQETIVTPHNGDYILTLEGAPCPPEGECLMGGAPLLVVEQRPVETPAWTSLQAALTINDDTAQVVNPTPISPRRFPVLAVLIAGAVLTAGWAALQARSRDH